jgi:hypothetical protein
VHDISLRAQHIRTPRQKWRIETYFAVRDIARIVSAIPGGQSDGQTEGRVAQEIPLASATILMRLPHRKMPTWLGMEIIGGTVFEDLEMSAHRFSICRLCL